MSASDRWLKVETWTEQMRSTRQSTSTRLSVGFYTSPSHASSPQRAHTPALLAVASLSALGLAPPAERGPSLESIYRFSLQLIFAKVKAENWQHLLHRYLQLFQRSTETALYCRSILLVFVRSCSSINNKIISLKNYFTTASWGPLKKKKTWGPEHVPSVPIG